MASGHVDKAETAIGKLVRKNNLKNVDVGKMFEEYRENNNILQGTKPRDSVVGQPAYADLFRGPRMRVRSVCILIM